MSFFQLPGSIRVVVNAPVAEVRRKSKLFVRNLGIKLRTHFYILRDEDNNEMIHAVDNDVKATYRRRRGLTLTALLSLARVRRDSPGKNRSELNQNTLCCCDQVARCSGTRTHSRVTWKAVQPDHVFHV